MANKYNMYVDEYFDVWDNVWIKMCKCVELEMLGVDWDYLMDW